MHQVVLFAIGQSLAHSRSQVDVGTKDMIRLRLSLHEIPSGRSWKIWPLRIYNFQYQDLAPLLMQIRQSP